MSYHNWFHSYFKEKHKTSTTDKKIEDILSLLESRGNEYLRFNYEVYKELYVDPEIDIVESKPQIIQQVKEELRDFLKLLINNDVKKILQIGLGHFGSTQFCLSLICDKVITVEYDIKNISNYSDREILYNQNIEKFIFGDSTSESVLKAVRDLGPFDAVLIDGNHSYEYVKKDYENYKEMIKKGGIITFHDCLLEGNRYGTPRVLREMNDIDINYITHSKEVGIAYIYK
jgi:predicted O-methyltransferase YrrM